MTGRGIEPGRNGAGRALDELLDAYGADPARWPADDPRRAAAWALIDSGDAAALQSLAAARALDRALDGAAAPAPSAALTGAVLQAAQGPEAGIRAWAGRFWSRSLLKPAGALACAMLLGLAGGKLVAGADRRRRRKPGGRAGDRNGIPRRAQWQWGRQRFWGIRRVTRRTLIILLIVSGGLNLFLVGVIAASVIVHWNRPEIRGGPGPRTAFRLYRAVDNLDEPQRSRARSTLKEKRPEIRARIEAIRAARRDLRRRIRDGAVSPEAVESGFRSLQRARGEAQAALHALVRQIADSLTPEQRQRFYREAYRWRVRKHKRHRSEERERQK